MVVVDGAASRMAGRKWGGVGCCWTVVGSGLVRDYLRAGGCLGLC